MADEADLADKDSEYFLDRALKAHRDRPVEVTVCLSGIKVCLECGGGIPEPRASIPFAVRCIDCQRELELLEKRYPK